MKPAARISAAFLLLLSVIALGWLGGILYWHFRIVSALRHWERDVRIRPSVTPDYNLSEEDSKILRSAGCRAFPYLVESLDPSKNPLFLTVVSEGLITGLAAPMTEESHRIMEARFDEWYIDAQDGAPIRQNKCALIKSWWRDNGSRYHQWWRFWSKWCGTE